MAQEQPQNPIEPEDPEFELEEHVKFRQKQQIINGTLKKLLAENVSDFKLIMNGTSYAYTSLILRNQGLSQINQLIQSYPHLRQIDLAFNQIKQIPTLFSLKFITTLNLSRNQVSSITFLSRDNLFPYLKSLNLLGNKIQTLPMISSKNLRHLNLNFNEIKTLEEFDGHPTLKIIELRGNKLCELTGLSKIPKLQQLYVAQNQLTSFKGLLQAPSLTRIHARKNKLAEPEFEKLQSLYSINLRENLVSKVDQLGKVPETVKVLNLLGTPLEGELSDNTKKEIWMRFRHYEKINKVEITGEQKDEFDKQYKERLAEQERQRLEKERQAQEQQQD